MTDLPPIGHVTLSVRDPDGITCTNACVGGAYATLDPRSTQSDWVLLGQPSHMSDPSA